MLEKRRSEPPARIFCLPFAGGSGIAFHGWQDLSPDFEVIPVDYPGHLMRPNEGLAESMAELVACLLDELDNLWERPFVLCGSSLGGLVAFELARAAEAGGRAPEAVVVAACAAPSRLPKLPPVAGFGDEEFLTAVSRRYGGPLAKLADDHEALELALPALRADIGIFEAYAGSTPIPISSPLTAISGQTDPTVTYGDVAAWREFSTGNVRVASVPGDHFFMISEPHLVLQEIRAAFRLPGALPVNLRN
jgi:surfactin synthase thioesterase subunit